MAFVSNELGQNEVYASGFSLLPSLSGERQRISARGGEAVRWNPNGKELIYAWGGKLLAASVTEAKGRLKAGEPAPLFDLPPGAAFLDVSKDGSRFLLAVAAGEAEVEPVTIIRNWTAGLR
jgi:hypothetical protein